MAPKRKEPSIGSSPMIGNGRSRSNKVDFTPDDPMTSMHSTINAEKFDDARFSEIRQMEKETSPLRIILFVVVVILIGGGGVLFFRNLISNDQTTNNTNTSTEADNDAIQETQSSYVIDTSPIRDSQAVNAPKNSEYDESALITVGQSTDTQADLSRILYSRFQTFGRLTFDFTTEDKKLPKTTINFESTANRMIVSFAGVSTVNEGLKMDQVVNDIVKEIRYNEADNSFIILFEEKTRYVPVNDGDNLILNFKTVDELTNPTVEETPSEQEDEEPEEVETEEPTTPADTNKPAAMHVDNEYSQNKQYVSSNVSTNKIAHDVYYFDNYVNSYQFSWAQKNAIGDEFVPNAVAYYDTSAPTGKVHLMVEISNLTQEIFQRNGVEELSISDIESKTGVSTSGSNLEKIELLSFENGTAKYRFVLNKKSDFKLWVDKTIDNTTGTISVTIKN